MALLVLAVMASGTHALHLPVLLLGSDLHGHSAMVDLPVTQATQPVAFAAAPDAPTQTWCSVEGVPPATLAVLVLILGTTWLLAASGMSWSVEQQCSPSRRSRPPPLYGARSRAALQVYRI